MDEETKERIVRAVLLFCALVVAGVAAYTTFQLFSVYETDISFSPPDAAHFNPPQEKDSPGPTSFDIKKEAKDDEEVKTYEDKPLEPYSGGGIFRSPLVISEEVDGKGRLVFIVIALEILLIALAYWKLDKRLKN